jgi:hypothetical protein
MPAVKPFGQGIEVKRIPNTEWRGERNDWHSLGLVLARAKARVIVHSVCGKGSACGFNCQRALLPPPLDARRPQGHKRARPIIRPPMYFVPWTLFLKPDAKACNHQRIHIILWSSNLRPDAKSCSDYLMETRIYVLCSARRYAAGRQFSVYDQVCCISRSRKNEREQLNGDIMTTR